MNANLGVTYRFFACSSVLVIVLGYLLGVVQTGSVFEDLRIGGDFRWETSSGWPEGVLELRFGEPVHLPDRPVLLIVEDHLLEELTPTPFISSDREMDAGSYADLSDEPLSLLVAPTAPQLVVVDAFGQCYLLLHEEQRCTEVWLLNGGLFSPVTGRWAHPIYLNWSGELAPTMMPLFVDSEAWLFYPPCQADLSAPLPSLDREELETDVPRRERSGLPRRSREFSDWLPRWWLDWCWLSDQCHEMCPEIRTHYPPDAGWPAW